MSARLLVLLLCACFAAPYGVRAQEPPPPSAAGEASQQPIEAYGAKARVRAPEQPTAHALPAAAVESLSEHMGPSFSLAETMPGAVPVFSGVPYVIVRGAPPSGTRMYYDGVAVPTLFHVALGPTIVNPHLLGALRFHPGVAPARFGRKLGGAFVADAALLDPNQSASADLSLSLLDTSAYVQAPIDHGTLAAAFRYGNPGLLMGAIGLDATLSYFDYQVRVERELSPSERLRVLGLGAGDHLGDRGVPDDDIGLDFHRLALRYTRELRDVTLGSELVLGYDASELGKELHGRTARVMPNVYLQWGGPSLNARVGMDMAATFVSIERGDEGPMNGTGSFTLTVAPQDFVDQAPLAGLPTRNAFGVYTELHMSPSARVDTDFGLRSDLWINGAEHESALDPSGRVTYHFSPSFAAHAALGLAHSATTSPVPLPGLDDVALDNGVQTSIQAETGVRIDIDPSTHLSSALFYDRYLDVVYLELILDCQGNSDPRADPTLPRANLPEQSICRRKVLPRADGQAYGLELYLERDLTQRLSGFATYTLSFAGATAVDGTDFTPQSDVRHLTNIVLQYDLGAGFSTGLRMFYRSGKMAVNTIYDLTTSTFTRLEYRLPGFVRIDVHASYAWRTSFARMQASIGWLNVSFSREAINRDCIFTNSLAVQCSTDYQPAIVLPNIVLRAQM